MGIAQNLLPELDHEMATTRKLLALIPADKAAWKPHPKSLSLGDLALHLVNLLSWLKTTIETSEIEMTPPDSPNAPPRRFESPEATLQIFDKNLKESREALAAASDETMKAPWSLRNQGKAVFTLPRAACVRSFILSHLIHHRGQLTVYLRLCEVPLPSVYGPTADTAV